MINNWTTILRGVVGSTAYNLDHPGSDVDRMSLMAAPLDDFLGLQVPVGKRATRVHLSDEHVVHEIGKFCTLGLGCNPSILELLWLDDYEQRSPHGDQLITNRHAFLSAQAVRKAFLGYADQQFGKLMTRGDGTFSSDVRTRSLKHARHLWRLVVQGTWLYTTGTMRVRLTDEERERCFLFAEQCVTVSPGYGEQLIAEAARTMEACFSPLPERPDHDRVRDWLISTRRALDAC